MKRIFILALIALLSNSVVLSQNNHIYVEVLGVGLLGSLNYERMIMDKVAARVGISSYSGTENEDGTTAGFVTDDGFSIMPFIAGASYLMGNKWKLELGGGISYWIVSGKVSFGPFDSNEKDASLLTFYGVGGVRYQNPEGGITYRLGINYLMIEDIGIPFPYLSLGYEF